jgi:hypothetical protein
MIIIISLCFIIIFTLYKIIISQRKQIIELNDKNNYYNEIIKLQKIILSRNSGKIFTLRKEIKLINKNMDELISFNDLSNNDF